MPIVFIFLLFTASLFMPVDNEHVIDVVYENDDSYTLPVIPAEMMVDRAAERELFDLVNNARLEAGVEELVWDEKIAEAARLHSRDMWERKYFAHENPDGENAVHRMLEEKIDFAKAGENLALTRTVERAHIGLMDSPGHKRNILDPAFKRIGIGVVDGGIYGKMFTQNFSD